MSGATAPAHLAFHALTGDAWTVPAAALIAVEPGVLIAPLERRPTGLRRSRHPGPVPPPCTSSHLLPCREDRRKDLRAPQSTRSRRRRVVAGHIVGSEWHP